MNQALVEVDVLLDFLHAADQSGLALPNAFSNSKLYRYQSILNAFAIVSEETVKSVKALSDLPVTWPTEEFIPIMAVAQHHGLPTRLLDWSYSPYVAAYFAAVEAARDIGEVENLAVWALNRLAFSLLASDTEESALGSLVGIPRSTDVNIHAQQALFTLHSIDPLKAGVRPNRMPLNAIIQARLTESPLLDCWPFLYHFTLPRGEAAKLLWLLAKEGVHGAACFPGLEGVVMRMKERLLWHCP